jgi:peptidyl-prolyl cis-trans isomerase D
MRSFAKWVWIFVALAFVGGFLLVETSGLLGTAPLTSTTAIAVVNGQEIFYNNYASRIEQELNAQQERFGRTLNEDDRRRVENEVFDALVMEALLAQEYERRITITDDELKEYARNEPPPQLYNSPELQTNGRFDPAKYQRFLSTATARQSQILVQLEAYYRSEIPRRKLFDQVTTGLYQGDVSLWRAWKDEHDSAQVSYIVLRPTVDSAAKAAVTDADMRRYFDAHKEQLKRPGRAVLSVVTIPKIISADDSAAVRNRLLALRAEIVGGAKFDDVAKRESSDSGTASTGGLLPRFGKNQLVPEFEKVAFALRPGEISQPVATMFGYHLIKVDERKGDSVVARHILLPIVASDSAAAKIDRRADSLARATATSDDPKKFEGAADQLKLTPSRVIAVENQPASSAVGRVIPGVSAWAFGGAKPGESSDLLDDDHGYYVARLDSLVEGGDAKLDLVKDTVRVLVAREKAIDALMATAERIAKTAEKGLETAAMTEQQPLVISPMFARVGRIPALPNEPTGAAFGLPLGKASGPIKSTEGVYVLRVDKRIPADSAAWVKQKEDQRMQAAQSMRGERIQLFLEDLRKSAKIDDRRKEIFAAQRRVST